MVTERNRNQRREMKNRVAALHGRTHAVGVADVAAKNLYLTFHLGRQIVQPAPGIKGVIIGEGLYVIALLHHQLGQMTADKTVRACN